MKVKFIISVILASATILCGCKKMEEKFDTAEVKVVFNNPENCGFDTDTKALRTGWEAGDQILIVYKESSLQVTSTLTYNGSYWTSTTLTQEDMLKIGNKGHFNAIYFRRIDNDMSHQITNQNGTTNFTSNYAGGVVLVLNREDPEDGCYQFINGEIVLHGDIKMSRSEFSNIQFSVPDLPEGEWEMKAYSYINDDDLVTGYDDFRELVRFEGLSSNLVIPTSDLYNISISTFSYAKADKVGEDHTFIFKNMGYKVGDTYEPEQDITTVLSQDNLRSIYFVIRDKSKNPAEYYHYRLYRSYFDPITQKFSPYHIESDKAYKLPAFTDWSSGTPTH